jgi:hypothetical protein
MTTATKETSKGKEKVEVKTPTNLVTFDVPLPPKSQAEKPRVIKVSVDPSTILVPEPTSKAEKRVDVRAVERNPYQPRMKGAGSETVDDGLILGFLGRHKGFDFTSDTDEKGKTVDIPPVVGQEPRISVPEVFLHKGKYTWCRGHRRGNLVRYLHEHSPTLAQIMFPDHTILCRVIEMDPASHDAAKLMRDHAIKDERRELLLIEQYDEIKAFEKSLTGLSDKHKRIALIQQFSKEAVDKILRLDHLPEYVIEKLRTTAETIADDAFGWGQLNTLYSLAQDHATKIQVDAAKKELANSLRKQGASEKQIEEQIKAIPVPEGRARPRPLKDDPGADFAAYWDTLDKTGQPPKDFRSLSRPAILKLCKSLADKGTKAQYQAIEPLLLAIANGKENEAASFAVIVLSKL